MTTTTTAVGTPPDARGASLPAPALTQARATLVQHGAAQYAVVEGRRHLVVPVVALVPGVLNDALVTAAEIEKALASWNGVPIPVDHPQDAASYISANTVDVLAQCIGRAFDFHFLDNRLKGNLYIDVAKAQALGGDAALVLARLERGEPVEVSTGYFADIIPQSGVLNGMPYSGIQTHIRPDHLAVLPHGVGACSWQDGCGAPRVHSDVTPPLSKWQRFKASMRGLLRVHMPQQSFDDIEEALRAGLTEADGIDPTTGAMIGLEAVYPDSVIYCVYQPMAAGDDGVLYSRSYQMGADGAPTFGDKQPVQREVQYVPVTTAPEPAPAPASSPDPAPPPEQGGSMEQNEKLALLEAHGRITAAQRPVFAALPDAALDALVANCPTAPAPTAPAPATNSDPEPVPTPAPVFDAETQAALAFVKELAKQFTSSTAALRQQAKERGFSEAVVNAMTPTELQTFQTMLQTPAVPTAPTVNFAGLGLPRTPQLSAGDNPEDLLGLEPPKWPDPPTTH